MLGPGRRIGFRLAWLAAIALALVAGACSSSGIVSASVAAGTVRVRQGDTLVVNLGRVSPGIGDEWYITRRPDPAVLRDEGMQLSDCTQPGCTGTGSWRFRAAHTGATAVTFQYCFRSGPPTCKPDRRGPRQALMLKVIVT